MKRMPMLVWVGLLGLLGLAGCAQTDMHGRSAAPSENGFDTKLNPVPRPKAPLVFVVNGYLVVDQEPIRLWRSDYTDNRVTIQWQLPAGTGYTWPASGGVTFRPAPPGLSPCLSNGKLLACSFAFESKGQYKYTLTALDANGRPLPPLDPYIVNIE